MTAGHPELQPRTPDARVAEILKLAIFAVGGQGGGVLNGWIVDLAERNGYDVQATSVAGVAQRTGATIYYLEMLPKSGRPPVFSLAPSEGDVDIVVAAELMEAGRGLMRGFMVPHRTKVIFSTHRQFATLEKVVPGDGISDSKKVIDGVREQAADILAFDMQRIAEEEGTVISAALFGALAGSGFLPFSDESFREAIQTSERGVETSLAAFERARKTANRGERAEEDIVPPAFDRNERTQGPESLIEAWRALEVRLSALPDPVHAMTTAGLGKVVSFQDVRYGNEYLVSLEAIAKLDSEIGGVSKNFAFTTAAAKHLANAMAYDDVIRVADVKIRAGRLERIEVEVGAFADRHVMQVTEYTHPGATEVVSLLPAGIGARIEMNERLMGLIDRLVNRGRHIRTDRIGGFLQLYALSGLRRWRRSLLRHRREMAHIDGWIRAAKERLPKDYDLAVETLNARRLIKGYSDTHARGLSKFDRVMEGIELVDGREDAADWASRLIWAALKDADGDNLDGALKTIRSFAER
ncbi:MAG: indolepyruvate oxidoreductase subunit beta family protein [Geminicoccaceae bacterium]